MSVEAMTWVFKHSPYKLGARLVHLALADVANDGNDWKLWMTQAAVAAKAGVSERQVRAVVKEMTAAGYLQEVERPRGKPVVYRFVMPDTPADSAGVSEHTPEGSAGDPGNPAQSHNLLTQRNSSSRSTSERTTRKGIANPAWDALVAAVGWDPQTGAEKARVGKAVREITAALPDGTSREDVGRHIEARARRYREHWPAAELTPESLVKHWSTFAPSAVLARSGQASPAPAPDRGTLTRSQMLARRPPEDLTYSEFLECMQVLPDHERLTRREARRQGLAWRVRVEHGEAPTAEAGWFYSEEKGWEQRGGRVEQ